MALTSSTTEHQQLRHRDAFALAEVSYHRFAELTATIAPDQWQLPTDCVGWTVRDLVGHMVGAMQSAARFRDFLRLQSEVARRVKRDGGNETDVMTAVQIEWVADLDTEALVAECRALATPAAIGRRRIPAPMRRLVKFPVEFGSTKERWNLGYLVDVILTRDAWMHRIDLARALGVEPLLTADHDGRIVADVVGEWASRHGQACSLELTGPAGGSFTFGEGGEALRLDAVDFCRSVSGRDPGAGLLAVDVPF